jgi:hypothetical protein
MRGQNERGAFIVTGDPSTDVFVEESFELVMCRHFVALAALLMEANPPAPERVTRHRIAGEYATRRSFSE